MLSIPRCHFMSLSAAAAGSQALLDPLSTWAAPNTQPKAPVRPLVCTGAGPGRGKPPPHTLKGDDLVKARRTPETWRLEIVSEGGCTVEKPRTLTAG